MKALLLTAMAAAALAQSPVKVVKQAEPEKALIFEVTIPATRTAVWQAFTTSDGLLVAVGTAIADRPPHRSVRAELPHTAPA